MKKVINDNKGYMLVEIIVASAIAMTMAFFLMEMTLKIVNKNNDYYVESVLQFDKNIITKEIMDDINSKKLVTVEKINDLTYKLKYDDNTIKELSINNKVISYGNYQKKLANELNIGQIVINNDNDILTIDIPAYTNYSKEDYGIKIVVPYSDIEIVQPKISRCYNILEKIGLSNLTTAVRNDSLNSFSSATIDGEHGIYEAEDDLGPSCYFRGDVDYNYVKFGKNVEGNDMYWRIIRINGDGTIRMIYDGTQVYENGTSTTDKQVGTSKFNENYNDNAYVGYMYGTTNESTYEATHENKNDSTMKKYLEEWYKNNIYDNNYDDYVADAIYCSDRIIQSDEDGAGTKDNITYYAGNRRNINTTAYPELTCARKVDRFTVDNSLGNGMNKYPIGLLTWDEVIYAGGFKASNKSYFLYSGNYYFIMTPSGFFEDKGEDDIPDGIFKAFVGFVNTNGRIYSGGGVDVERGVRPVISLNSDAIKYGTGLSTDPFRVE